MQTPTRRAVFTHSIALMAAASVTPATARSRFGESEASIHTMKRIVSAIVVGVAVAWTTLADSPRSIHSQPEQVTHCLISGCFVYSATITTLGPLQNAGPTYAPAAIRSRAVTLQVDKVFGGNDHSGKKLDREYVTPLDDPMGQFPMATIAWGVSFSGQNNGNNLVQLTMTGNQVTLQSDTSGVNKPNSAAVLTFAGKSADQCNVQVMPPIANGNVSPKYTP